MAAEDVIIDFKVDYSELTAAQEQLAKSGKIDSAQFDVIKKAISTTATDTKGLITDFKNVATTATKMGKSVENAFGAGIQDALDEAGVSMEDFSKALIKANTPTKRLETELRALRDSLAKMKLEGKDTGAEFEALKKKAGIVADAIADANKEIKNAGSDTRNIDNVVGSISALAGGFAAVQGAAALFGDESEDVQKALLKVNGAMALASGIQQFYNATLKEGALAKLADSIQTGAQTAAMTLYSFVTAGATVATKALRVALLATGIGAIVVLLVAAANAMGAFGDSTEDTTQSLKDQKEAADNLISSLEDISDAAARARAGQAGGSDEIKRQIALAKAKGESSQSIFDLEQKLRQQEIRELKVLGATYTNEYETRKRLGTLTEADAEALNNKIIEINKQGKDKNNEIIAAGFEFQREQNKAALDAAKKLSEEDKKRLEAQRAFRLSQLNDTLARLETELLQTKKGGEVELAIKKEIVRAKADIELNAAKVSEAQAKLINERAKQEQLQLQRDFNKTATAEQLQSQIDTNAALLAGITLNNEERLRLQIENLETSAQLEINAAQGNAAKILLIEAKKQSDIRALKIKAIDDARADEIAGNASTIAVIKANLQKIASDATQSAEVRKAAVQGIYRDELQANQNLVDDLKKKLDDKLISQEEYNKKLQILLDQRSAIERGEIVAIDAVIEDSAKKREEELIRVGNLSIQVAQQVADFFSQLSALATEQDRQRIDLQKQQLQALVDAGAITAKQAKIQAQQIEIAERKARQAAAQREKQAAVFKALLSIPQAFLTGLTQGGPVLAAIYAAIAAAQAAVVIARPIPKFFRGKKGSYEGPAEVADMGSEIVERNGRMFLYTNPTKTYLGAKDKVYTAAETRNIMHNTNLNTTIAAPKQERFDYDRLAKDLAKNKSSVNINIEKDFISEAVNDGLMKTNYFNKRYGFK